jgi:putative (di)nucleoside polyphosphate hydrolase
MSLLDFNTLPYRPGAGVMLLNARGLIWIGHRCGELAPQETLKRWQMPQGGIDKGEEPEMAARRELQEETGIRSVEILGQSKEWIYYDLAPEDLGIALGGKYRGQRQRWFAMRFTGNEQEIDLYAHGHKPEFDAWRWATAGEVLDLVVDFKRPVYEAVMAEFQALVKF